MDQVLAEKYKSLNDLRKAKRDDLADIQEIGPEIARSVTHFFSEDKNRGVLRRLEQVGVKVEKMPERKKALPQQGRVFVFTGMLDKYTRDEAEKLVEEQGRRATSSVSGETDYLVAGKEPGRKLQDAEELKVRILNEEELERMVKG